MRHAVNNYIAFLNGEYSSPITLAHTENARFTYWRSDVGMRFSRRTGDLLESIQQPSRICLGHSGELLQHSLRNKQRHKSCSLIASCHVKQLLETKSGMRLAGRAGLKLQTPFQLEKERT
jgi:hypothetical protein